MARTSQPQILSGIDWSNPLTRGMSSLLTSMPYGMVNHSGHDRTLDSGTLRGNGREITRRFTGGTQAAFSNNPDYQLTGAMTVAVIADADTLTNYGALASCQTTASTNGWELRIGSNSATNGVVCAIRANSATKTFYAQPGTNIVAAGSKRNFVSVTYPDGNVASVPTFNVNGVSYTGTASGDTATGSAGASTGSLLIGKRVDGVTKLDGAVYMVALWNRMLSFDELEQIRENPWQLFKPVSRVLKSAAAGGTDLSGSAQSAASASGVLTTSIDVVGAALSTASATGSLTSSIDLIGQSASVSLAGGELTTTIRLSADSLSSALASAGLTSGIALGASGSAISNAVGSITTQITLSSAAVAQALATADISTSPQGLSANAAATASGSASLMTDIPLSGSASAIAIGAGGLTTGIVLQSSGAAVSSATGDLTINIGMSASALAQAVASGDLSAQISLSASALAQAMASATISGGSGVTYETPDGRILTVPEDGRVLFIGGEIRELIIPAENRVLYVREVQP